MDRIKDGTSDTMTQFFAQQQRDYVLANLSDESALDDLDKTTRADICPGTYLKLWDDVSIYNDFVKGRIVCAAGGRACFFLYRFDPSNGGHILEIYQPDAVTDRAPADPNEAPMPIVPPSP